MIMLDKSLFKKGESNQGADIIGLPPSFLTGLVIAGIIIALIGIPLIVKPLKLILGNPNDQGAKQTFGRLLEAIDNEGDYLHILNDEYYIYGFEKNFNIHREKATLRWDIKGCQEVSCICLYKKTIEKVKCEKFGINTYFLSENIVPDLGLSDGYFFYFSGDVYDHWEDILPKMGLDKFYYPLILNGITNENLIVTKKTIGEKELIIVNKNG